MLTPSECTRRSHRGRPLLAGFLAAALILAFSLGGHAAAADQPEPAEPPAEGRPLAEDRWIDREYGISLRLPIGVRTVSQTGDRYQIRVADEDDQFLIGVSVRQSRRALTMTEVLVEAAKQLGRIHETSEPVAEYALTLDDIDMGVLMFRVPDDREDDAFDGQAFIQIDPHTFAIIEVNSPWRHADEVRATYEAMLQTIELNTIEDLEKQREREVKRLTEWRRNLGLSGLHDALVPEQRFRIMDGDDDIGYMLMLQEQTEKDGRDGIQVTVRSRVVLNEFNIDSEAFYFSSDDDSTEYWTVTTTQRPRRATQQQSQTFQETGIRSRDEFIVTREDSFGSDRQEFTKPPQGYVPLAETWLLPRLLPNDRPATYGFYSYNSQEKRLTYRTEQIVPTLDGYVIHTRLRPNAPELEARFDAQRNMRQRELGPQRRLVPTTARELEQIWRNR